MREAPTDPRLFRGRESISGWVIKKGFKTEIVQTGLPGRVRWQQVGMERGWDRKWSQEEVAGVSPPE